MVTIKTYYIRKMDKPIPIIGRKIKIRANDNTCEINLKKEKDIKKIISKMVRNDIENIVISKELFENRNFINALNASGIKIFDGRWLIKYLTLEILDYIVKEKNMKIEETEIAIASNEISDIVIENIKILSKKYKRVTVITNHINKLRKIEKEIYEKEGILIVVSNNQKKSLLKTQIILNMDFNKEVLNKYSISENAIIINLEGDMKIYNKRFNGININDYEIEVGREETIWRENFYDYNQKDLLEAILYMKDTYKNIRKKILLNKVQIKELYGINGKIERFS